MTSIESNIFTTKMFSAVFILFFLGVAWGKLDTSPSGFHFLGKLCDRNNHPLANILVGYNYSLEAGPGGNGLGRVAPSMMPEFRRTRIYKSVKTDANGIFSIDIDKTNIAYVTILGFWDNESAYLSAQKENDKRIRDEKLIDILTLTPWPGGVVKHFRPGLRPVDAIFGWGSKKPVTMIRDVVPLSNPAEKSVYPLQAGSRIISSGQPHSQSLSIVQQQETAL